MNKTQNINLGGKPFTIDEEAYLILEKYLDAIHRQFMNSAGSEEIMNDIEIRLSELFQERLQKTSIINTSHVSEIMDIMGRPSDFQEHSTQEEPEFEFENSKTSGHSRYESYDKAFNPGKKLYRDTDNDIIGGVCSGLSQYFGIDDPIWMRLIFLLLVFGGGGGVLIYIVLWILVPEAKTSSDRLKMKGEPVNISSIAKDIEKEVSDIGDKITDFSKDFKWKNKKKQ